MLFPKYIQKGSFCFPVSIRIVCIYISSDGFYGQGRIRRVWDEIFQACFSKAHTLI